MAEQAELTRPETAKRSIRSIPRPESRAAAIAETSLDEALGAAGAAHQAFLKWRRTTFAERGAALHKAAEILRARKDEFARFMTEEMGKTLTDGLAEVEKCAFHCDWFADHAAGLSFERARRLRRRRSVRHL